jgi:hypothetical protein
VTSIRTYDPADGAVPPELPPMPIGVLAAGAAELLQQAADLPQPWFIAIFDTQSISLQFAPEQASIRAVTRWALRFGSVMASQPGQGTDGGPQTWHRTDFEYYGIAVRAYAHIPAGPVEQLADQEKRPDEQ